MGLGYVTDLCSGFIRLQLIVPPLNLPVDPAHVTVCEFRSADRECTCNHCFSYLALVVQTPMSEILVTNAFNLCCWSSAAGYGLACEMMLLSYECSS